MFTATELRERIIRPVLIKFETSDTAMENLLFGTCAHESKMGLYLKQIGGGPALGPYQMEPDSYKDIWDNYLSYRPKLAQKILEIDSNNVLNLLSNPKFATAMAYIQYKRANAPLPEANDILGLAEYWKKYYNTSRGKGIPSQFVDDYNNAEKRTL